MPCLTIWVRTHIHAAVVQVLWLWVLITTISLAYSITYRLHSSSLITQSTEIIWIYCKLEQWKNWTLPNTKLSCKLNWPNICPFDSFDTSTTTIISIVVLLLCNCVILSALYQALCCHFLSCVSTLTHYIDIAILSVRLSVCPWRSGIRCKWLNILS